MPAPRSRVDGEEADVGVAAGDRVDRLAGGVEGDRLELDAEPGGEFGGDVDRHAGRLARAGVDVGQQRIAEVDGGAQHAGGSEGGDDVRIEAHGVVRVASRRMAKMQSVGETVAGFAPAPARPAPRRRVEAIGTAAMRPAAMPATTAQAVRQDSAAAAGAVRGGRACSTSASSSPGSTASPKAPCSRASRARAARRPASNSP